jgi:hypothetical protein
LAHRLLLPLVVVRDAGEAAGDRMSRLGNAAGTDALATRKVKWGVSSPDFHSGISPSAPPREEGKATVRRRQE